MENVAIWKLCDETNMLFSRTEDDDLHPSAKEYRTMVNFVLNRCKEDDWMNVVLNKLKTDHEKITKLMSQTQMLYRLEMFTTNTHLKRMEKDERRSEGCLAEGKRLMEQENFEDALELANEAVMFSPAPESPSEESQTPYVIDEFEDTGSSSETSSNQHSPEERRSVEIQTSLSSNLSFKDAEEDPAARNSLYSMIYVIKNVSDTIEPYLRETEQPLLPERMNDDNQSKTDHISVVDALWFRSEVLLKLQLYDLALRDLTICKEQGITFATRREYYSRLGQALKGAGKLKEAKNSFKIAKNFSHANEIDQKQISMKLEALNNVANEPTYLDTDFTGTVEDNNFAMFLSPLVTFNENKTYGQHAVAKSDIPTGEILIEESPYASVLLPECFKTHCQHCFRRVVAPIWCKMCARVRFCSFECQKQATNNYHRYECAILETLEEMGASVNCYLALRMVTQIGLVKSIHYYKKFVAPPKVDEDDIFVGFDSDFRDDFDNKDNNTTDSVKVSGKQDTEFNVKPEPDLIDPTRIRIRLNSYSTTPEVIPRNNIFYDPKTTQRIYENTTKGYDHAQRVYTLGFHPDKRENEGFIKILLMSIVLKDCLKKAHFFEEMPPLNPPRPIPDEVFIIEMLMRHLELLKYDSCVVTETTHCADVIKPELSPIALGLYGTAATVSHECYPTVGRYYEGKKIILRAIRPMKTGSLISDSYGPSFITTPVCRRQRELESQYHFVCLCAACEGDWTNIRTMSDECPPKFRDTEDVAICDFCFKEIDRRMLQEHNSRAVKYLEVLRKGVKLTDAGKFAEAIEILPGAIDGYSKLGVAPFRSLNAAEEALKLCYAKPIVPKAKTNRNIIVKSFCCCIKPR